MLLVVRLAVGDGAHRCRQRQGRDDPGDQREPACPALHASSLGCSIRTWVHDPRPAPGVDARLDTHHPSVGFTVRDRTAGMDARQTRKGLWRRRPERTTLLVHRRGTHGVVTRMRWSPRARVVASMLATIVALGVVAGPALAVVNSVFPSTNDANRSLGWAHVNQGVRGRRRDDTGGRQPARVRQLLRVQVRRRHVGALAFPRTSTRP